MKCLFLPLIALVFLASCIENVETRGHIKDADWKDQIITGKTTRDEVLTVLGSPSSTSSFGQETWYYISTQKESVAFFKPEVVSEDVTRITFNTDGTVATLDNFDKSHARDIAIASRVTPTEGHQMTVLEQLLGNMGRFNSPASTPGSVGTTPRGGSSRGRY